MRIVIAAFLFCLTSSIAYAQAFQIQKPIICDSTQKIIRSLVENYNEKPVWTGKDARDDSRYSLFINNKTGTWTLLQMTPEVACILGVGDESKFIGDSV